MERLKDQDIDGVAAEVLYTSLGMPLFSLPDTELQRACFRVYNDWLAEFSSYSPKRLYPIALISLDDVADGVREMERCVKQGHRGVQVCGVAPPERPYLLHRVRSVLDRGAGDADSGFAASGHRPQVDAGAGGAGPRDAAYRARFHDQHHPGAGA